jgi:Tfp pilus assembly protein PilX
MRQLMRSQDGVALPVATGLLLVVSLLVVGFFTLSLRVNDTSVEDRSSKRALAAAEAGLQMAVYRLNQLNASPLATRDSSCLTTTWVALPIDGQCPGLTEQLGNGAQYTYWVTPADGAAGCVRLPTSVETSTDRCITAVGTVNGVSRRIQTRVISRPFFPSFGAVGLVGKSLVHAINSINLTTDVGSNVLVRFENSINVNDADSIQVDGAVVLHTNGQYQEGNSVNVEGGTETTSVAFDMPLPNFESVENSNNNPDLVTDLGTSWNAGTRRINMGNSVTRTIDPGTYHVCGVHLGNSVNLRFSHTGGATTRIFVDSPDRPGSSCASQVSDTQAGAFTADNSVKINEEVGQREELLEIYMWGTTKNDNRNPKYSWCESGAATAECQSDFMLDNSVNFYGKVLAPNSSIQAHNSVNIFGSIAGDKIRFYNSVNFELTAAAMGGGNTDAQAAERKGWAECRPQATVANDPESGCT